MSTQQDTNPTVANAKAQAAQAADKTKATINQTAEQIKSHPVYQQGQQRFTEYMGQLDKELGRYPALVTLEERTGVPKNYGAVAASLAFLSMIFVNALALPVSNLVGWAFPAFLSMRALETPGHEDDIQWLTYWSVFGFFTFLESFAIRVVLYYVPWYFPIKTFFLIWLQLPTTRGAHTFYHSVFRPVVNNFKSKRAQ
ncbi:ER membrane protein DP1/Yop1, partial [Tulasnella sp. 408]